MLRFFEYLKHKFHHFITFIYILFSRTCYEFLAIFYIVIGFFLRVFISFGCLIKLCDAAKRQSIEDWWHEKVQQIATKWHDKDTEWATLKKSRESEREEKIRKRSQEREAAMQALLDGWKLELDKIGPLLQGDKKTVMDAWNKYHSDLKKQREKYREDLAKEYETLIKNFAIKCFEHKVELDHWYYEVFCAWLSQDNRGSNLLFTFILLFTFFLLWVTSLIYGPANDPRKVWPQPKCRPRDRDKPLIKPEENNEQSWWDWLLSWFSG
jgi:hypothetical protein